MTLILSTGYVLHYYQDFNNHFHLYADALDHQMVAFIMQNKIPNDDIGIQSLKKTDSC
jgi:hypothetical protein